MWATNTFFSKFELLKKTPWFYAPLQPYNRYYFSTQTETARKTLYETKVASHEQDVFMNVTYGVSRLRDGMFAFHIATGQGYDEIERTFLENEKCGLVEISYLGNDDTWTAIQKRSVYKEILKVK